MSRKLGEKRGDEVTRFHHNTRRLGGDVVKTIIHDESGRCMQKKGHRMNEKRKKSWKGKKEKKIVFGWVPKAEGCS